MIMLFALAAAEVPRGSSCDDAGLPAAQQQFVELAAELRTNPSVDPKSSRKAAKKLAKKYLCTPESMVSYATVLLSSRKLAELELAHELALEGTRANVLGARVAAAYALDRVAIAKGLPQPYGTQVGRVGDDPSGCMHAIAPNVSDEDREGWGLQSREALIAAYLVKKGIKDEKPDNQTLARLNRVCEPGVW